VIGQTEPAGPTAATPRPRHVVAFAQCNGERREPLFVGGGTARILELSDGTRTAQEIAAQIETDNQGLGARRALQEIEELFVSGLLWLHEDRVEATEAGASRSS
jgi:hypothetical protein